MTVNKFDQLERPVSAAYNYPDSSQVETILHWHDRHFEDGRFISIAEFNKGISSLAASGFVDPAPLITVLGFFDGTIALYGVTAQPGQ